MHARVIPKYQQTISTSSKEDLASILPAEPEDFVNLAKFVNSFGWPVSFSTILLHHRLFLISLNRLRLFLIYFLVL